MIYVKTTMRKLPEKCTKCRFSRNGEYYETVGSFFFSVKKCVATGKEIPYEYSKEKNNWHYVKPDWCPLREDKNK